MIQFVEYSCPFRKFQLLLFRTKNDIFIPTKTKGVIFSDFTKVGNDILLKKTVVFNLIYYELFRRLRPELMNSFPPKRFVGCFHPLREVFINSKKKSVVYSVVDRVFKAAERISHRNEFIHDDNYTTPELPGADASARGASKRGSDVNTSQKGI